MQILRILESVGLTREHLTGVNNDEIIRIEKKLIAESRLNEALTKNDVSRIVKLLKDYPDVLQWLSHYQCLYGILTGVDAEEIDTITRHPAEEAERIREVIAAYFYDDVLIYINLNFNAPDWNNIRVLLYYKELLPINILNVVFQRLQNKVDFGLNELKRHTSENELDNNCKFLTDKQFFMLLSDVDLKYFERYIYAIATYIKQNRANFKERFMEDMIRAMRYFNATDLKLDYFLRTIIGVRTVTYPARSRSSWFPYAGILFVMISLLRFCANSESTSYVKDIKGDTYNSQSDLYQESDNNGPKLMDSAKIKMQRFVEARYFSLNYPLNSWKTQVVKPAKYANPFANDVFQFNNIGIRHNQNSLCLFNSTDNECVVIAYYRENYDIYDRKYTLIQNDYPPFMYAIYVPPGDSIKIDFKMSLLRFYMGHNLSGFNTYKNKVYPDSSDVKFAKFTSADSLLFCRPFVFNGKKLKTQRIIISKPTPDSYQLQWKGSGDLYPFRWPRRFYGTDQLNSTTNKKTLLLRVPSSQKTTGDNVIPYFDAFLN